MGIESELKELKTLLLDEKLKEKKFKFPFSAKVTPSSAKKNWVTVIKINDNGNMNIFKKQIQEQTIMEDGVPRFSSAQYMMYYKKNPVIILPSWSVRPYSPAEKYEKALKDGSNSAGYKILMNKMLNETTTQTKQISGAFKLILIAGLAAVVGYAIITGGGGA